MIALLLLLQVPKGCNDREEEFREILRNKKEIDKTKTDLCDVIDTRGVDGKVLFCLDEIVGKKNQFACIEVLPRHLHGSLLSQTSERTTQNFYGELPNHGHTRRDGKPASNFFVASEGRLARDNLW